MPSPLRSSGLIALVCAVALLATGCGGSSPASVIRRTPLNSMFEAQGQLLAAPGPTLDQLRRLGVDSVRVFLPWASLAPSPESRTTPAGFDPSSPAAYPAVGWQPYDALLREAAARGIAVDVTLEAPAPLWTAGRGAPPGTTPRSQAVWKPSAGAFGAFVRAVARRYNGTYRPAGAPSALPRVSFWSIWNEPNYGPQLAPQATDHSTVEVSPRLYRGLLDAAWGALVQTGHGHDTILIGEVAPRGITTGDNPGNFSGMVPLRFLRALYCVDSSFHVLQGRAAALRGCPGSSSGFAKAHPALFDASGFAVHPYPQGGVRPNVVTPFEPDYADLASLPRLERTLDRLQAAYGSSTRFPIYDTEFGYQTNPPEKIARTTAPRTAAAYMNWAEYIHWRDPRVRTWDQYLLTDPPRGNFATGLEFADGTPKPAYDAYRMPIYLPLTLARHGQPLELWGCVRPARYARLITGGKRQTAQIQFRPTAGSFSTINRVTLTDPSGYLDLQVKLPGSGLLRLAWTYPDGRKVYSRTVSVTVL